MPLSPQNRDLIRACSKDEAAYQQLVDLYHNLESSAAAEHNTWEKTIQMLPDAVYIVDVPGKRMVYSNGRLSQITGYPEAEIQAQGMAIFAKLLSEPDLQGMHDVMQRLNQAAVGEVIESEFQFRHQRGEMRWIHIRDVVLSRQEDGSIGQLLGIAQDITVYKQMEHDLRRSQQSLQMVIQGAQLGTWDWNIQTGAVQFNERWAQMLGYTLDEIEPHVRSWERLVHPEDNAHVTAALDAHLKGEADFYEAEHRLRKKDGGWLWVLDSGQVIERDDDGRPLRAAGIHLDITDRKQAEQQSLALTLEKQRVDLLNTFIQDASHEFRTPLSVIQTSAYLMERADDPALRQQKARQIREQIDRIERLVNMLLLQSRLDSGASLNLGSVRLNDLIQELAERMQVRLRRVDSYLKLHLDRRLQPIAADEDLLAEAVLQVLDNAVRYSPPGSVINIRTRSDEYEDEVQDEAVIEIVDMAGGIDNLVLPHIFERFFRHDSQHSTPGLGLGLPLAQAIVEKHQGTISIHSRPGDGSTVVIRLPARLPIASLGRLSKL